jgi:subtilisin family serine protease
MDVFKYGLWAVMLTILAACGVDEGQYEEIIPQEIPKECEPYKIADEFVVQWKSGAVTVEKSVDRQAFIKNVVKPNLADIEQAEYNFEIEIHRPIVELENKSKSTPEYNWGMDAMNSQYAWDLGLKGATTSGEPIIVAVIDSGVNILHNELITQILINEAELNGIDGEDDDNNGYVDDFAGWNFFDNSPFVEDDEEDGRHGPHGSHVAGIIAARHDVGLVTGVAPEAKILPLDFMHKGRGDTAGAINSIDYAVSMGAKVINASWGGEGCSTILAKRIKNLESLDVLFVAAAGNSGQNLDYFMEYPARFNLPAQITVGATTDDAYMAGFSNFGRLVHVAAPGYFILSTVNGEDGLAYMSGTSMAAPMVAGVAAIMRGAYPEATALQVKQALIQGVHPYPFDVFAKGEVRVDQALAKLEAILAE